ncbi:MAG TPA: hypothetical protein DDW94_12535 [Deltaproteobacteria bacterium]|nr:MAG: hypothetical protein A2Z79_08680 [Deltaproteobacteria bacterium GWA2_55_82]OGQ64529.1 MAG: hypothetical protein A3I81_07670 [Deltaproteobacteria bacterium RIFCSPLOWO2_02_FULL_55_12]OIJ73655.1 MAG: hypothetical protein A2V21_304875 [Deltaproteobacteria bacterium GWC2_55_46]HBG47797.1 hypothetical protein [Deltaproteobacteria bacterium]HCY11981.1 hypothetical protein [Deltaproteobacteria bacterium]
MAVEHILIGEAFLDLNPGHLTLPVALQTLSACVEHHDFEVVELRSLKRTDGKVSEIIVVDCINDQVPSRNPVGIKVRERLALVFTPWQAPEVRVLRKDFPEEVPHLNYVGLGQPAWLCIYFEPWSTVERTWTPQKFLRRILWWLSETAEGTLHREDQPLERIYYDSPLDIVLPPDFKDKIQDTHSSFTCVSVERSAEDIKVIRGIFVPKTGKPEHKIFRTEVLMLELLPVIHGTMEVFPRTLGQFHDQIERRGEEFISKLKDLVKGKIPPAGLTRDPQARCLLIFSIPVKRNADADPESHEVRAFLIAQDLAILGATLGVLTAHNGKFYSIPIIGAPDGDSFTKWREMEVIPVQVKNEPDKTFARKASGIQEDTADFKGVLLGLGALGSALAELWSKEFWGEWTFIDPETFEPHNIIRHVGKNQHIGRFKVDVVKDVVEANYHLNNYYRVEAIADSATNRANGRIEDAISGADLLVDATTTLDVPRDLSQRDGKSRSVSVFLTPSGEGSVLLLEPADLSLRLDSLEAQYYRAILNSDWGWTHLQGHMGMLWVGAGCRDISAVISNESIQLHAAVIARQVRVLRDKPEPRIRIWSQESDTGALISHDIPVQKKIQAVCGEWNVIWDAAFYQKLCSMRHAHLPNESGGIVLGYIDQKLKSIYIVDALSAPPDSSSDRTGFTRGVEGLAAALNDVARRTANIVGYIGEWHSHPSFTSAYPSGFDRALLESLAKTLALEGQPALMIIVGSGGEISIAVKEG